MQCKLDCSNWSYLLRKLQSVHRKCALGRRNSDLDPALRTSLRLRTSGKDILERGKSASLILRGEVSYRLGLWSSFVAALRLRGRV